MRNGVFLFLLFGITLNCFADSYDVRIAELTQQKLAKMQELEECGKSVKGFKIAGISTIGLTAVGVGGNIALANKQAKLDEEIEQINREIAKKENKILVTGNADKGNDSRGGDSQGTVVISEGGVSNQDFDQGLANLGQSKNADFCTKCNYEITEENVVFITVCTEALFHIDLIGNERRIEFIRRNDVVRSFDDDIQRKNNEVLDTALKTNFKNANVSCKVGQTPRACVNNNKDFFEFFEDLGYVGGSTGINPTLYDKDRILKGEWKDKWTYERFLVLLYYNEQRKNLCNK